MRDKSFLDILTEKLEKRIREDSHRETQQNFYKPEEIPSWISKIPSQKYTFTEFATNRIKNTYSFSTAKTAKPQAVKPGEVRVKHQLNEQQSVAFAYFLNWKMGISQDYTAHELKSLFRKLAHRLHPDRNQGSSSLYLELKKNYDLLKQVF